MEHRHCRFVHFGKEYKARCVIHANNFNKQFSSRRFDDKVFRRIDAEKMDYDATGSSSSPPQRNFSIRFNEPACESVENFTGIVDMHEWDAGIPFSTDTVNIYRQRHRGGGGQPHRENRTKPYGVNVPENDLQERSNTRGYIASAAMKKIKNSYEARCFFFFIGVTVIFIFSFHRESLTGCRFPVRAWIVWFSVYRDPTIYYPCA